jgi:hypothetical protein
MNANIWKVSDAIGRSSLRGGPLTSTGSLDPAVPLDILTRCFRSRDGPRRRSG